MGQGRPFKSRPCRQRKPVAASSTHSSLLGSRVISPLTRSELVAQKAAVGCSESEPAQRPRKLNP